MPKTLIHSIIGKNLLTKKGQFIKIISLCIRWIKLFKILIRLKAVLYLISKMSLIV
jgi:hypothetical protein